MVLVRFISSDGDRTDLGIEAGMTVMEGAVRNGVDGIDADCGGQLSCATCHVRVGKAWLDHLPPISDDEREMLEFAVEVDETSRLSCQIPVTESLNGVEIHIPSRQAG